MSKINTSSPLTQNFVSTNDLTSNHQSNPSTNAFHTQEALANLSQRVNLSKSKNDELTVGFTALGIDTEEKLAIAGFMAMKMKNYEEKFPEFYQFLGSYFHQDWKDFSDWKGQNPCFEGIVRHFKLIDSKSKAKEELTELKDFLSLGLTENEIEQILRTDWGIAFRPAYINLTHKAWLERILEILEEPIEETKKHFIPEFIG